MAPGKKANAKERATGSRASAHPTAPLSLRGVTRDGTPLRAWLRARGASNDRL